MEAAKFVDGNSKDLYIKKHKSKVGWTKSAHVLPNEVFSALSKGATRNVFIGGLDNLSVERLGRDLEKSGDIERVNLPVEKRTGFVNFANILSAAQAVEDLQDNPDYVSGRVGFGRGRCAQPARPKTNKLSAKCDG